MFLRNLFFLILGIALVAALSSCRRLQRVAYYRSMRPDPAGWQADVPLVFTADSASAPGLEPGQYQLFMVLRFRDDCPVGKLHLQLEHTSLMRGVRVRGLCVDLEHPAANPGADVRLNKGLIQLSIPLGHDYVDQGWSLSVQQRMVPPPVTGINDIGIKIVR